MRLIREVIEYQDFFREFTLQQLRSRYRGSVLGFLWTLLNPLLLFATFSFIFSYINRVDVKTYVPMFFGGYIPWLFFTKVADASIGSVVSNSVFFTRVHVARGIFPLSAVAANLLDFGAIILVGISILAVIGVPLQPALVILPLSILVLMVFVVGIAFLFSMLNVFFRDFAFVWSSVSFLWFFVTPILYPVNSLSPMAQQVVRLNPFLPFLELFQQPIAHGMIPRFETWIFAGTIAAFTLIVGVVSYQNTQRRFYEYL